MSRFFYRSLSLLLALLVLFGGERAAFARQVTIEELIVTNSHSDLLLFLTLKNAFTKQMEEGIKNGIPASFTFSVEVLRLRRAWLNQEMAAFQFSRSMAYDPLKEEYIVSRSEAAGLGPSRFKSLSEAKNAMNQVNGLAVLPLKNFLSEEEYRLQVKARLAERTLPLSLQYVIPFWKFGDFETDWYSVDFRY